MASSKTDICSAALSLLGDDPIADITDGTSRANLCKTLYDMARDAVLRLHPWNFAIKRAQLAPEVEKPLSGYANKFVMPSELLRLLSIDGVTDFKVEGRRILSDESSINIRYVYSNENIAEYDALFVMALAAQLAALLAYPITKSNTTKEEMENIFKGYLQSAKAVDAQEEPGDTMGDFPLINIRS